MAGEGSFGISGGDPCVALLSAPLLSYSRAAAIYLALPAAASAKPSHPRPHRRRRVVGRRSAGHLSRRRLVTVASRPDSGPLRLSAPFTDAGPGVYAMRPSTRLTRTRSWQRWKEADDGHTGRSRACRHH